MRIKCIKNNDKHSNSEGVDRLEGLRIDTFYQVTDLDNIGYRIIDDLGQNFWYSKDKFEPIEDARNKKINQLINYL